MAARLAKSSQVLYHISGFISLLESAYKIVQEYLLNYGTFQNGVINDEMIQEFTEIAKTLYDTDDNSAYKYNIIVNEQCARRAYDITMGNIEQYKLLMHITDDDAVHWTLNKCSRTKSTSNDTSGTGGTLPVSTTVTSIPLKLQQKANRLKAKILLHSSLLFIKSGLYVDRELKNASSALDVLLKELVEEHFLLEIKPGIIGKFNKPSVFIKTIPATPDAIPEFVHRLSNFNDGLLSYDTYITNCKNIDLHAKGSVSRNVFIILEQAQYRELNLDYSSLYEMRNSEFDKTLPKQSFREYIVLVATSDTPNTIECSSQSSQPQDRLEAVDEQMNTPPTTMAQQDTDDQCRTMARTTTEANIFISNDEQTICTSYKKTTNQIMVTLAPSLNDERI